MNKLFCSSSGSGDILEKHKFQNQLDVFFLLFTVRKDTQSDRTYLNEGYLNSTMRVEYNLGNIFLYFTYLVL